MVIDSTKLQNADLIMRIESLESDSIVNVHHNKFEFKIKELETRLELEQTTRFKKSLKNR